MLPPERVTRSALPAQGGCLWKTPAEPSWRLNHERMTHDWTDKSAPDQDFLPDLGSAADSDALPEDDPDVVAGMTRLNLLRAVEDEIPLLDSSGGFGGRPRKGRPRRT